VDTGFRKSCSNNKLKRNTESTQKSFRFSAKGNIRFATMAATAKVVRRCHFDELLMGFSGVAPEVSGDFVR
jgi:hypothetical protein